ncbi:MAG: hypothetical protein ACRD1T_22445, partial [Acidimicrobiia bacterium]
KGKYAFLSSSTGGVAASGELRLPTGDEDNLLGTGATQIKGLFIGSRTVGDFSTHVNFGYTFSSGELSTSLDDVQVPNIPGSAALAELTPVAVGLGVPDEFNYTFGVEYFRSPRITAAFDVIGRTLRDIKRFEIIDTPFEFLRPNETQVRTASLPQLDLTGRSRVNLLLGVVGAKFNVAERLLLTANVVFPMTDAGLKPRVTPVFGFDYAF